MKRIIFALLAAVLLVGLFTPTANAASGDSARKKNAACVTKAEYKKVKRGHTLAQVKRIFGTGGRTTSTMNTSYWQWGDYVSDGFYEGAWYDNSYYDEYGNYVYDVYYDEFGGDWIDNSYWEPDTYVSQWDSFRDYKKCKSFGHGRGRVAINFDNYTSRYSGYRVYSKAANRPWIWNALGLRTTSQEDIFGDKPVPSEHEHASSHRTKAEAAQDKAETKAEAKADKPEPQPAK
jgi:outer membrane protein assembly factor BamE (lipoprotein component of BamABCDE complex)